MKIRKLPVPSTRDPFVNTPLINAGFDPETGEERFWISTWNDNVGCLGVLVTPSGKSRIYRIKKGRDIIGCGAYSACLTDNDTIWMISDLQAFCRLTLSTGEYEFYDTGADSALVFAGMQYDEESGKLMAVAFPPPRMCAVSFDIKEKKTVKIYDGFAKAHSFNGGFANGDGTYSLSLTIEEDALYIWNPKEESLKPWCEAKCHGREFVKTIRDERNRVYIPHKGWLNPDYTFSRESIPELELQWFGKQNNTAYGFEETPDGVDIFTWDIPTGKVKKLCSAPDGGACALTRDGEILDVSLYGEFMKFSSDGKLLMKKTLDATAQGRVDCLIRADENTLLGTPFITQRFWTMDINTATPNDAGRAAPGTGEVLLTWNIGKKVYLASYTKGILTEYDPSKNGFFPDNPRIVAQVPNGMRPVAKEQVDSTLYYSCSHHYGELGCVLTKYNTEAKEALYSDNPLPNQHINSLTFDSSKKVLLGGTTFHSDCDVTKAKDHICYLVEISPDTLEILHKLKAPENCEYANAIGPVDKENILVSFSIRGGCTELWIYNTVTKTFSPLNIALEDYNAGKLRHMGRVEMYFSGKDGDFVINAEGRVFLVSLSNDSFLIKREVFNDHKIYAVFPDNEDLYGVTETDIYIAEGALL